MEHGDVILLAPLEIPEPGPRRQSPAARRPAPPLASLGGEAPEEGAPRRDGAGTAPDKPSEREQRRAAATGIRTVTNERESKGEADAQHKGTARASERHSG